MGTRPPVKRGRRVHQGSGPPQVGLTDSSSDSSFTVASNRDPFGGNRLHDFDVAIIGSGPAGLTAAYEACKAGLRPVVLERDEAMGGIARTVCYRGFRFDIGGHR